jgi:hypothetical protein
MTARTPRPGPQATRGYRNRNPGNIDHSPANKWLGLAEPPLEPPPHGGGKARFAVFVSHEYGIRALAVLLQTYQDRHGLRTVAGIINRWAPAAENNTRAYISVVSHRLGVRPDDSLDLHNPATMRGLVEAIIAHELGGNPYTPEQITEGLRLAGLVEPGVAGTRTARVAAGTAAAGVATAGTAEILTAVAPHASGLAELVQAAGPWLVAATVAGIAAWFVWRRARRLREMVG